MGLYETWQHIVSSHHQNIAVHPADSAPLRFHDLQSLVDQQTPLPARQIQPANASDGIVPFLVQTLRAWRDNAILCPVESDLTLPKLPDADVIPAHIAHLKFTSGTTGEPRCIMFRTSQLAADAENIRSTMGLDPVHPNLSVISLAHSYGFSNLVLPLLLQGHPLIVASDVLPASLVRACSGKPSITLPAVPAMWRAWFRAGILDQLPIHLAITAGAPMPVELEQTIHQQHNLKIHNFLGSSECGAIAYDPSPEPRTGPSYVGHPAHNVQVTISADNCLEVQSNAVAEGYLPAHPSLQHGKFITTDLAELHRHAIHLLGRASDTINLAGRKLDPTEIETLLLQHPDIHHCVVFGVPSRDATRCEETVAIIRTELPLTQSEIAQWIGTQLPPWKRPRHYWFTQELTPNARGKTPRPLWREKWLNQHKIDARPHTSLVDQKSTS
ncbi:long-chain fatty acid--CoA ligase [Phragmitibacter flavus]|uniref:Long-chain fatty acid--CoA ligase n=1 Tax=Phragmitibacter flavus TaxID=2576071 RepID=A0A5R8K868_9BACT|nr:fatty acid--CoA ligase family protein [Phragmitibacter flavus]TLD68511.1 long-chain fatty acid--CoA ligase [Phragmitibacter flavus]